MKKIRKNILISSMLIVGGLEGILGGCAATKGEIGSRPKITVAETYNLVKRSIDDPANLLKCLREEEYVIPDNIWRAGYNSINTDFMYTPFAIMITPNLINTYTEKQNLKKNIQSLNLTNEEELLYHTMWITSGSIIITESRIKSPYFKKTLFHERIHREIMYLPEQDQKYLQAVDKDMQKRRMKNGLKLLTLKRGCKNQIYTTKQFREMSDHFYTTFLQDEFRQEVGMVLKNVHPKAYEIIKSIGKRCKPE
ncbi:MAG: hypothetical protein ABIC04_04330 [Nanoarchaeota archaeon]